MKEKVLVLCAHSDDQVIGAGGTIARHAKSGDKVLVVIFSKGEKSVPWLKEELVKKAREDESKAIAKHLGCRVGFLGLPDMGLITRIREKGFVERVIKIIEKFSPDKIFTHSLYDAHPDHQAVYRAVMMALEEVKLRNKPKIFTFAVWGASPKNVAKLYVDISETFRAKIDALRAFKTQRFFIFTQFLPVYIRARIAGFKKGCKYAEVFYVE